MAYKMHLFDKLIKGCKEIAFSKSSFNIDKNQFIYFYVYMLEIIDQRVCFALVLEILCHCFEIGTRF